MAGILNLSHTLNLMKLEILKDPEDGDGYWVNICELDGPAVWGDGPFESEAEAQKVAEEYVKAQLGY